MSNIWGQLLIKKGEQYLGSVVNKDGEVGDIVIHRPTKLNYLTTLRRDMCDNIGQLRNNISIK